MTANANTIPPTLLQLGQLSMQLQQLAEQLPQHGSELDPEHTGYIRDAASNLLNHLHTMAYDYLQRGDQASHHLEDRNVRHDLRNFVAVMKGFGDLLMMDLAPDAPASSLIETIGTHSDRFVQVLDSVKAENGEELPAFTF